MTGRLINLCVEFTGKDFSKNAVVPEPYIPFIPDNWNGYLVLAEAQNLSTSTEGNRQYTEGLQNLPSEERISRLYDRKLSGEGNIGIWPWDDGSLKIAVASAFKIYPDQTAVSNAVLWSLRNDKGKNLNPTAELITLSCELWKAMLEVIKPKYIVTAGKVAKTLISNVKWDVSKTTSLALPSRLNLSTKSWMFSHEDLRERFPEVNEVYNKHPEYIKNNYIENKIFYACHAVSIVRGKKIGK